MIDSMFVLRKHRNIFSFSITLEAETAQEDKDPFFCIVNTAAADYLMHDDVIKWKHFPSYWPFVRGIHWSLTNSLHRGQWCGALMFSLICSWTKSSANHQDGSDLILHCTHYDVTVKWCTVPKHQQQQYRPTSPRILWFWHQKYYSNCKVSSTTLIQVSSHRRGKHVFSKRVENTNLKCMVSLH